MSDFHIAIVGGGIVGLATACALLARRPGLSVLLIEKEERLAQHQTSHSSGVIHSGLYYRPGSLKARMTAAGARALVEFCKDNGIPFERCGKVVVATEPAELERLAALHERGLANGVEGIERIGPERLREIEPHAVGLEALWVPSSGIVDYTVVAERYGAIVKEKGGVVELGCRFDGARRDGGGWVLLTSRGEFRCRNLISCAGVYADRVARRCGSRPGLRIVPFRGEFRVLRAESRRLVRGLIYPVPDPTLPFLGVHLTKTIDGGVEAGPNAVLALHREGYRRGRFNLRDCWETFGYSGVWRLGLRHWRTAIVEERRSLSAALFLESLQRLVPELTQADLERGGTGVRAQAVAPNGDLLDDFRIETMPGAIHVLNAPSPAATASIPIGEYIAGEAANSFGL